MGFLDFLKPRKSAERRELDSAIKGIQQAAFPLGDTQIQAEASRLHQEMNGRLSTDDCRMLVQRVKVMILLAESRDEERLSDYVYRQLGGKLSREESRLTYLFIEGLAKGRATKGTGDSAEDPIVIQAENTFAGIKAEYQWLADQFGERDRDWEVLMHGHGNRGGRTIETFRIKLKDGSERDVHFDISNFYGKYF